MTTTIKKPGGQTKYSEAFINRLRELIGEGHTGSECAGILGEEFMLDLTRNAIMGIAYRNYITSPKRIRPKVRVAAPPVSEIDETIAPTSEYRCGIMELTGETCRFPLGNPGDADFFYCGAPKAFDPSRPYCQYHERIAYALPPPRHI